MNIKIKNEDIAILEKMRNELSKETRKRLPPLKGNERHWLLEATRKVDKVMNKIEVGNITELNDLVYAGTVVVTNGNVRIQEQKKHRFQGLCSRFLVEKF